MNPYSALANMKHNLTDDSDLRLQELRQFLDQHSDDEIKNAIATEDFSHLICVPEALRHSIASFPDLWNDIRWYVEIRNELRIDDFPCVHIAYATSAKASNVIGSSHGVFAINIDDTRTTGIVIGYCPWCATPLNVSVQAEK